jgi:ubiquinone/menaquinone biosynthesis C-methylase UbiE
MQLKEAISLIQTELFNQDSKSIWADLGCGSGLFTQALASKLHTGSVIYAVDKNISPFKISVKNSVIINPMESDFVNSTLDLKNLDGILMANSLHFVRDKKTFLNKSKLYFKDMPVYLIVEYDTDKANPWIPYPISFLALRNLFMELGYITIKKLHERKSLYHTGSLYSVLIIQ